MTSIRHGTLRFLFSLLLCFLSGFLISCGLFGGQKDTQEGLFQAADRFNKDVRWEDYKSAVTWIIPSEKEDFWNQIDRLQGRVRIIDYQVVDAALEEGGASGTVALRYRFFPKNNPQPQTKTLYQKWLYSREAGGWQIVRHDLQKLILE